MQIDDIKIEILTRSESVRYSGQLITFQQQETTEIKNRIRAAWATFHKYRQELTSKNCILKHRLRLFDAAVTPTICYASGTWAPTKEHERMTQSAQRKMLRLIIQTKRRYKKIVEHRVETSEDLNNIDSSCTDDESEDGKSDTSHNDQDSDVSFEIDNDEEIDAAEIEEEEWEEYIKRSTNEAMKKMEKEKIRCWNMTKMKWRLAMRIATSPSERWLLKAAGWNPEFSSKYRTNRSSGRPRKRWEDDINEFLKQVEEETENLTENGNQINKNLNQHSQKNRKRWTLLEENYTTNSEGRHENNARTRSNSHNKSARYVNGVKLSDPELADIT